MPCRVSILHCFSAALVLFCLVPVREAVAENYQASSSLIDAYALLAQAVPIYEGHRARAMQHVRIAVTLSGGKIVAKTPVAKLAIVKPIRGKTRENESSSDSDERLRSAQNILQGLRGISGKAGEHVGKAIEEISTALSVR